MRDERCHLLAGHRHRKGLMNFPADKRWRKKTSQVARYFIVMQKLVLSETGIILHNGSSWCREGRENLTRETMDIEGQGDTKKVLLWTFLTFLCVSDWQTDAYFWKCDLKEAFEIITVTIINTKPRLTEWLIAIKWCQTLPYHLLFC